MNKIILIFWLSLTFALSLKAQENKHDLTIEISGLNSNTGSVFIALYNNKKDFLKNNYKGVKANISNKKTSYTFKELPEGTYAVSFFNDENNNKKLDTNFLGIPKEQYGFSNNAKGFMGPPKYDDAKFQLSENKAIEIKI